MSQSQQENAGERVYAELIDRLGEAQPQPRLGPVRRVVELLGDPQNSYPVILIAGTNGKTSTSRITESLLRSLGLRTGLFTSPHLERFNERIVIDGQPISDEALAFVWDDIAPYLALVDEELVAEGEPALTFFEAMTVLAYASFADAPVEVAVVEVGMGGEWDSTNIADPAVSVFTPIDLDHTERLGNTVAEIATTKSGIMRAGGDAVTAKQHPEVEAVLEAQAHALQIPLLREGVEFAIDHSVMGVGGQVVTLRGSSGTRYDSVMLPLYGEHQAQNAAVALAAVEAFTGKRVLAEEVLEEGYGQVTIPGRLQLVGATPPVYIDAAHNPHGARALVSAVKSFFAFDEVALVFGSLNDKDSVGVIAELSKISNTIFVTQSSSNRSRATDDLAQIVRLALPEAEIIPEDNLGDAIEQARGWAEQGESRGVIVAGSIVLIGEVMTFAREGGWSLL
ncbi:folylpolyglutamate synthase/dihydrofolate synthase family protein [Lysinibacter sp. HNR]|uniref:bifunctional folylpolyglutamate synthase/dihydrofolate synthase n=1 Tax=Lysinibacter sp. HNR TaxID=3031408 RepID=UPI002435E2D8|nr:folylpolyglutamate synthase/dihydrofolate synthase family protein [Lysinibacter sp. HNR]WGD36276.1 bifunctional folylpolyglutamate synthase/dihydrofolate synthase [Lysinibacter sp. HNR]